MACVRKRGDAWVADFRDQHGKRHQLYRKTKKAAEAVLAERLVQVEWGTFEAKARTKTLEQLAEEYLEAKAPTWRESTRDLNRGAVHNHILHADYGLGSFRVKDITEATCGQFRARMMAARPKMGPRMVNLVLCQLGALLNYAARCHLRADNPARFIERLAEPKREVEILTPDGLQRLMAAMPSERDRVLVMLAARTGCRFGELTALTWADLDEVQGRLYIRATNSHHKSRAAFVATGQWPQGPKTRSSAREILLSPETQTLLRHWRQASGGPGLETLLFRNKAGHPLDRNLWRQRIWLPAVKVAGIGGRFTIHCLRHCYASRMLAAGVPVEFVSKSLGHSNVKVTSERYRRWTRDADAHHAAAIDLALTGSGE